MSEVKDAWEKMDMRRRRDLLWSIAEDEVLAESSFERLPTSLRMMLAENVDMVRRQLNEVDGD